MAAFDEKAAIFHCCLPKNIYRHYLFIILSDPYRFADNNNNDKLKKRFTIWGTQVN